MIRGQGNFNFIDKRVGVTKEGEQYILINVISQDNKNYSFISKDSKLIDRIASTNLAKFAPLKLNFDIEKEFNPKTRYSNWTVNLIGVD